MNLITVHIKSELYDTVSHIKHIFSFTSFKNFNMNHNSANFASPPT